jgi:osmotically-inducible protein OsmY
LTEIPKQKQMKCMRKIFWIRMTALWVVCALGLFSCATTGNHEVVRPAAPAEETLSPEAAASFGKDKKVITLPDPVIRERLAVALVSTKRKEIQRGVNLRVSNGHVYIAGQVGSFQQRALVERLARTAPGVKRVTTKINVKPQRSETTFHGDRRAFGQIISDKKAEKAVRNRLFRSPQVTASKIRVEVYDGVVVLSGYVGSAHEKKLAKETALFSQSVRSVIDNLVVLE